MNAGELLTSIKMDLGIYGIALPFDDPDKTIMDTIKLRTIKTFSQFYPHIVKIDLNLKELENNKTTYQETVYKLPDAFGDRRIMYIRSVKPRNKLLGSNYMNPVIHADFDMYSSMMMMQSEANLLSTIAPPFTFHFTSPNLLHLYNLTTLANEITVEFGLEHFDNLSSIKNTTWESFYELALLDVKRLMYNMMKHYNEIQTAHGTINMRIDDWSNAESERRDLIERWRAVYHLEADQFIIV